MRILRFALRGSRGRQAHLSFWRDAPGRDPQCAGPGETDASNIDLQAPAMRGDGVDIHTAMIATQKADLAFNLALSVRNKAVAAYQQVMGMQF